MENKISINDESWDRKYFLQLPNCILNHSTAVDQALYCQMKRFAGETGKCFASKKTLMAKLKIGKTTFKKSLNYLLEKGWIKFDGLLETETRGGKQVVRAYSIVDIWKQNILEYSKAVDKGGSETEGGSRTTSKGGSRIALEEELYNKKKKDSSKKKGYYAGLEVRKAQNKLWCIPKDGSSWLEFAGKKSDIEWR